MRAIILAAVLLAVASPAAAQRKVAPEPAKPVPAALYSGTWYEVARTPNRRQRNCQAPTVQFGGSGEQRTFSLTCRQGSPAGKATTQGGKMTLTDGERNAKFQASFALGIAKPVYHVLDRADDSSWALLGTSGGNFVWLLSRNPTLPEASKQAAVARAKALGYAALEYPQQPPAA